jgi:hypothetical protein
MTQVPACRSFPRLEIYQSNQADRLIERVNTQLARDGFHVCAVSLAAIRASRERDSINNTLLKPHFTTTVISQVRITPAAFGLADQSAAAV